jgi:hypothetical protein
LSYTGYHMLGSLWFYVFNRLNHCPFHYNYTSVQAK